MSIGNIVQELYFIKFFPEIIRREIIGWVKLIIEENEEKDIFLVHLLKYDHSKIQDKRSNKEKTE